MILKRFLIAKFALFLIFSSIAYSQQLADTPSAQSQPQVVQTPVQNISPQLTPQQADALKGLSPEQQRAMETELSKTGGALTPEAIEILKTKPEFQGLSPEHILKGKKELEKKETEKKPEKKE